MATAAEDYLKIGYTKGKTAPVLVNIGHLKDLIAGDLSKMGAAFLWGDTGEGPTYWDKVRQGLEPLPVDRLTVILNEAVDHPTPEGVGTL